MNKLVAMDIDGVLADFENKLVNVLWSEFDYPAANKRHLFSLEARFKDHPEILSRALLYVNTPNFYRKLEPIQPMIEFVDELVELGFGVMFLTSRPSTHEEVTRRWLERNLANYKKTTGLFVGVENKADFLLDVMPDFLVDDNPAEILRCKQVGVPGLCYEQVWNLGVFPRIVHDRNWEVYLQLSEDKDPFHLINSYKEKSL